MKTSIATSVLDFSSYINERTRDFTGRTWVFNEFDAWLRTRNAPRYFMVVGEPGIGKTAIAARLTQQYEMAAIHFCIARQVDTLDPLIFVRSLTHQLTRIDGFAAQILEDAGVHIDVRINVQENYGEIIGIRIENLLVRFQSALTAFNRAVVTPLKQLYANGFDQQLVILVDALDEALQQQWSETIVDLLSQAQEMPWQVRFVLTSRKDSRVLRQFEQLQLPLLLLNAERDENMQDVREYVYNQLRKSRVLQRWQAEYRKPSQVLVNRVAKASQGNFLYLVYLLPALANGTQRLDAIDTLPKGLSGMYRELLRTRVAGKDLNAWRTSYRPLLGVLAAARTSLTENQLAQFTRLDDQSVHDLLFDLQQFLDPMQANQAQYRLYHQSIAEFLRNKERAQEFWIDLKPINESIVNYYRGKATTWDEVAWNETDDYGLRYLATHLYVLRDREEFRQQLYGLLCQSFLREKYSRFDSHRPFVRDLLLTLQVTDSEDPPDLVQEVRVNLIYATLGSLASNVPLEALEALAQIGQIDKAVDIAASMHGKFGETKQLDAYYRIIEVLLANEQTEKVRLQMVVNKALAIALTIEDPIIKVSALERIIRLLARVGEHARANSIANQAVKQVLDQLLTKATVEEQSYQRNLPEIVPVSVQIVPRVMALTGQVDRALQVAQTMKDPLTRADAFNDIAEILAEAGQFDRAYEIAQTQTLKVVHMIEYPYHKARVLYNITRILAHSGQVEQALMVAQMIEDQYEKVYALISVTRVLAQAGEHARAVIAAKQALVTAQMIEDQDMKAHALIGVTEVLAQAGEQQQAISITKQAVKVAQEIRNLDYKANALGRVAKILIELGERAQALAIANRIVELARSSTNKPDKNQILSYAAQVLARAGEHAQAITIANEVLAAAETHEREKEKDRALVEMALTLAVLGEEAGRAMMIVNQMLAAIETGEDQHNNDVALVSAAQVLLESENTRKPLAL